MWKISWQAEELLASQKGPCSLKLDSYLFLPYVSYSTAVSVSFNFALF
jgi:hypothetical protein